MENTDMNNLYLIDKRALYEDICKIEDEYRKSLLKEKDYNTYEAQQKQGLLNATTLIKHFIFDYPIVEDYKYEINNLRKMIRELNHINKFGIVFCHDCKWASPIYHSPECYDDDYIWCSENDMCYDVEHYCKDGVKKDD